MIECSELKDTYELITNDECKSVESVIQITPGNNFVKKLSIIEPSLDDIDGDIYSSRAIMCKDLQIEEILQNSLSYLPGIEAEKNKRFYIWTNKYRKTRISKSR